MTEIEIIKLAYFLIILNGFIGGVIYAILLLGLLYEEVK